MQSAKTVSELIRELYSEEFAQALDNVDFEVTESNPNSIDLDRLANKYLDSAVRQAMSDVNLEDGVLAFSLRTPKRQVSLILKWKRTLVLILLVSLLLSAFRGSNSEKTIKTPPAKKQHGRLQPKSKPRCLSELNTFNQPNSNLQA